MSSEAFWGYVRATIRREWIRLAKGTENVDAGFELTATGEKMVDDLVQAFEDGKKVPGLSEISKSDAACTMNWVALACFARYYCGRALDGNLREYVREQLTAGVSANDLMKDELLGTNWYTCTGNEPEDEKSFCCPDDVINDWYYKALDTGKIPVAPSSGSSWITVALVGLGVFAVAMSIRFLSASHQNPASSVLTLPHGKTPQERQESVIRHLRLQTASMHTFEVWDETRDYLRGEADGGASYIFDAMKDLRSLVDHINATGKRTSENKELERILDLSAGAS
jgi:hypothetical protein